MQHQINTVQFIKTVMKQSTRRFIFRLIGLLLLGGWGGGLQAQTSVMLEDYIRLGLENNPRTQSRRLNLQQSDLQIKQAKALGLPTLTFNANYTRALGGRKLDFPIGDLLNPAYSALNAINPQFMFPTLENQQIQFLPDNFHETKLNFAYPLYNTDIRYNRRIQQQLRESQDAQLLATEHELRYQITEAYVRYLQTWEAEKIWKNTREVLLELKRLNESLVKNNVATKDIITTADYELNKIDNELFALETQRNTAQAYVNLLLFRDLQTPLVPDTNLLRALVPDHRLEPLLDQAQRNRQELRALQSGINASETAVKLNQSNQKLPDLYIGGELGFQGFGYKFNGDQAYMLAQVSLSYDLYDGGQRKQKTQISRIEAEKMKVQQAEVAQQIQMQVIQTFNEFLAARFAFETAKTGVQSAESVFRIVNNKYRSGQALLIELLEAQNRVTTARLQQSLAWSNVILESAELNRIAPEN